MCVYVRVCVCVCVYVYVFHFSWVIGRMSNSFFFPRYLKAAQTFESRPPDIINGAFVSHFELAISSYFYFYVFFIFVQRHLDGCHGCEALESRSHTYYILIYRIKYIHTYIYIYIHIYVFILESQSQIIDCVLSFLFVYYFLT